MIKLFLGFAKHHIHRSNERLWFNLCKELFLKKGPLRDLNQGHLEGLLLSKNFEL
jgi:hypothetical protein